MLRVFLLVTTLVSLIGCELALTPDFHVGETFAVTHVSDHLADHGTEHFENSEPDEGERGVDHSAPHHHNCSFDLPRVHPGDLSDFLASARLAKPFADYPLRSRALEVLIQPPIA